MEGFEMIKGTSHIAITVQDMAQSLKFYTEALGFKKIFEINNPADDSPWIVYLSVAKGQFVELFYNGSVPNPWRPELIGFNHLCFEVDDIDAAAKKVLDAGYEMDKMPNMGCDNNYQAWTKDPNGIRIELMKISADSPHAQYM
jgi:catechol 2,3-dioxygenase-like lactoylglutathione lyase family enzyme